MLLAQYGSCGALAQGLMPSFLSFLINNIHFLPTKFYWNYYFSHKKVTESDYQLGISIVMWCTVGRVVTWIAQITISDFVNHDV